MYGFTVNADGNVIEQLNRIEAKLAEVAGKAKEKTTEIEEHFKTMGEGIKDIFGELKGIVAGSIIAGGVFGGIEFIKSSHEAYENLEKSITRVKTVLESTKYAAGMSTNSVVAQAKELGSHIVNGRAEILDAQGMLLSFTGIKGPVFGETTKAVADFAQFYKEDMTTAALQIGKALNDPAKGMNRLQRQGVAFTEEQKKQIKNYQEQGNLLAAQRVILKELHTEFGGQAEAFAGTDAGKIAMDAKQWGSLKLEIGEIVSDLQLSLLPIFAEIRGYVKEAFESAPIQFFIAHIKDLLEIGLRILPIWITYRGIMISTSLVTSGYAAIQGLLATSMLGTAAATGEATIAAEGFNVAMSSTGIGLISIAVGGLVEQFISLNKELSDSVDKIGNFKENAEFMERADKQFQNLDNKFGIINQLDKPGKEQLFDDLKAQQATLQSKKDEIAASINSYQEAYNKAHQETFRQLSTKNGAQYGAGMGGGITDFFGSDYNKKDYNAKEQSIKENLEKSKEQFKDLSNQLGHIAKGFNTLGKYGIKHGLKSSPNGGLNAAYNTSNLAGASGGLGEAKVINIHIDTMQKIQGFVPADIKNNAESAIQILIRAVNNLASSQSSTM